MFKKLTKNFSKIINSIKGNNFLTKNNILEKLHDIRIILLKADVSFQVVRDFISNIKKKCIGKKILNSLKPSEMLIDIVQKELSNIMGSKFNEYEKKLNINNIPSIILLIGLQGCGKTTTVGKLSKYLKINYKKKILNVSVDIYRPAALIQLEILSKQANVDFFKTKSINPIKIINKAIIYAKKNKYDILIVDTAGRSVTNKLMMKEIKNIYTLIKPSEILLVVDSMLGQDSLNIANTFNFYIPFSGIILTKLDSDTKGGVALSITKEIKKPIKFIGNSEKLDGLEIFNSNLMSKRILGMKNIFLLIKKKKKNNIKKKKFINSKKKIKNFNFNDFKIYILKIKKFNLFSNLFYKFINILKINSNKINQNKIIKYINLSEVIINSMTLKERKFPKIINYSNKKRIANGAGVSIQDVDNLLIQFESFKLIIEKYNDYDSNKIIKDIQNMFNKR